MKRTLSFLVLTILILSSTYCIPENQKKITIVFRFDDYSAISRTDLEKQIIENFSRNNFAFTIGVIPYVNKEGYNQNGQDAYEFLGPEKEELLKNVYQQGIVEVALHGYTHQRNNDKGIKTEFAGLNYDQQSDKIDKGKIYLEKIIDGDVITFIPPWNSYDLITLKVLQELNFKNISADLIGEADKNSTLNFIPETIHINELQSAIEMARENKDPYPILVVMFHQYDFLGVDKERGFTTISQFGNLLDWLGTQEDIVITTLGRAKDYIPDLSAGRYAQHRSAYLVSQKILPVISMYPLGYYFSRAQYFWFEMKDYLIIVLIPLAISLLVFLLFPNRMKRGLAKWSKFIITATLAMILIFVILIFMKTAGYKVIFLAQLMTGFLIGLAFVTFRIHKTNHAA